MSPTTAPFTVRAFAPASVSNLACGFDVLGLALPYPGDMVTAHRVAEAGVALDAVTGDGGRLPRCAEANTAGVAARVVLEHLGAREGVRLELYKGLPLASGLGSSAASAVAAAVAVDALFDAHLPREVLLAAAMEGERVACGSAHADNAAPSLYGGFTLIRGGTAPEVIPLPVPDGLSCAVVRPHLEISTAAARAALGSTVPLVAAVRQWGNLGGLVTALFRSDWGLLSRCLEDAVAEPLRSPLIPGFAAAQAAALEHGALGASISGAGPSLFALCRGLERAQEVARGMARALRDAAGLDADLHAFAVGAPGARILGDGDTAPGAGANETAR